MITYLEILGFFLADDMGQVTSMHTSEHLALTGEDLIGILPDALKLLRSSPSTMILANTLTQERKNQQTTEPRPASLEPSVQKLCNIRIQQSIDLINLSFPIT